ncbi:hypothetical protein BPTFM16_02366 [Altererythrobacter insulae]|nr:hypothetical protein BPTFM16_02366 [Altererythrobacter insulae]
MSLLCFIFIGALTGWLTAIVTRTEDSAAIRRDLFIGVAGAVVAGLIANNGAFLGGLSVVALAASIAGAVIVMTISKIVQSRSSA